METKNELKTNSIAKVNEVSIVILEEGKSKKLVPIRPICDALGIDAKSQRDRIDRDEILSSVEVMTTSTGSDGKEYEMACLPLRFVFGWLFSIDTSRVKEESREAVIQYKLQCYNALFDYFSEYADFVEIRSLAIDKQLERYQEYQAGFRDARQKMDEAKAMLNKTRSQTFETYKADKAQFKMEFLEQVTTD